jgi:hypothetical protein
VDLQLSVGLWPLFSSLILYTVGTTPWTEDLTAARPLQSAILEHYCIKALILRILDLFRSFVGNIPRKKARDQAQ